MAGTRWIIATPLGHRVRLSDVTWHQKILVSHPEFTAQVGYEEELRLALEDPEWIIAGWEGELLSLRWCPTAPKGPKHLCVVYRAAEPEGFVITAFFISRYGKLLRRQVQWQRRP